MHPTPSLEGEERSPGTGCRRAWKVQIWFNETEDLLATTGDDQKRRAYAAPVTRLLIMCEKIGDLSFNIRQCREGDWKHP